MVLGVYGGRSFGRCWKEEAGRCSLVMPRMHEAGRGPSSNLHPKGGPGSVMRAVVNESPPSYYLPDHLGQR